MYTYSITFCSKLKYFGVAFPGLFQARVQQALCKHHDPLHFLYNMSRIVSLISFYILCCFVFHLLTVPPIVEKGMERGERGATKREREGEREKRRRSENARERSRVKSEGT